MSRSTPPSPIGEHDLASHIDLACAPLRREAVAGSAVPPGLETLMDSNRRFNRVGRPVLIALAMLTAGGAAFGGYSYFARSWRADVHVQGKNVEVMLNGERVPADQVEWLPDGNCLVTVNGAKILLDPRQPGGARGSISVQHTEDATPPIPVEGVPLHPDSD